MLNKIFNNVRKITVDDFLLLIDDDDFLEQICDPINNNYYQEYNLTNAQYLFRLLNQSHEEYQLMMIKKYCSKSFIIKNKIKNKKYSNGFNEFNFNFIEFFYTKDFEEDKMYIFNASNLSNHVFEILIENGLDLNYNYYKTYNNSNIQIKSNLLDFVFQSNNLYLFNLFYKNGLNIDINTLFSNYLNFLSEYDAITITKMIDKEMYCSLIETINLETIIKNLSKKPLLYEKYIPIYLKNFNNINDQIIFDEIYFIINCFNIKYPKENIIKLFKELINNSLNIYLVIEKNYDFLLKKILDNNLFELIEINCLNELFKKHEEKMTKYLFDNKNYELLKIFINMIDTNQSILDNLLFQSITIKDLDLASILIECGANPFYENEKFYGLTCIHVASYLKLSKDIFNNLSRNEIESTLDNYKKNFNFD